MKKTYMKRALLFMASSFMMSVLILLMLPSGYAYNSGHIGLLTVSETSNNTEYGGTADLQLVIKPGSGRIFIDSYPLSKIDTQITMRFAAEMACDLIDKDCSNYDFFYTITANSALVGGPSAGAAATVLTVALLDNQVLDNKTIMTGTIDSGNLIGPVSGVPAKALAAQRAGYRRVLIPAWDIVNNTPNETLTIDVIKVITLEDALYQFTGKNYSSDLGDEYGINSVSGLESYTDIMREVALNLCTKYGVMDDGNVILPNLTMRGVNITNSSQDNFASAKDALDSKSYYSAASFCFGGNVKLAYKSMENMSNEELKLEYAKLLGNISEFESRLDAMAGSLSTISELETYMIVAERLSESKSTLSDIDPDNISAYDLSYASERFGTAIVWSEFSRLPGQKFVLDDGLLMIACTKKLAEAEERLNYLELYYPKTYIRDELEDAYDYYHDNEYALCIFKASKVKADSNILLSAIFVPEDDMARLLDAKLDAARTAILKQSRSDVFPILGYSYYEYAGVLREDDVYSALLYSEYALEMSNLDMYFKKKESVALPTASLFSGRDFYVFLLGVCIGMLLVIIAIMVLVWIKNPKKHAVKTARMHNKR